MAGAAKRQFNFHHLPPVSRLQPLTTPLQPTPHTTYRGRLAPSPTGYLHVGHARTFWLAAQRARAAGGTLLLRNDDLDRARCRPEFVAAMLEDLRWLGLAWDGPVVVQGERLSLYRAALENLRAWVAEDAMPPESDYPMASKATRVSRSELIPALREIPGLTPPDPAVMTTMYPLDLGPNAEQGIGDMPAKSAAEAYPDYVSTVDEDGNETAGVRMPDVAVPVATHTGFNPRDPSTGGAGQLLEYVGSSVPFAKDAAARKAAGDPRPSIAERYADRDDYLAKVRRAAEALVEQRWLLARDVDLCVEIAAERYDICTG